MSETFTPADYMKEARRLDLGGWPHTAQMLRFAADSLPPTGTASDPSCHACGGPIELREPVAVYHAGCATGAATDGVREWVQHKPECRAQLEDWASPADRTLLLSTSRLARTMRAYQQVEDAIRAKGPYNVCTCGLDAALAAASRMENTDGLAEFERWLESVVRFSQEAGDMKVAQTYFHALYCLRHFLGRPNEYDNVSDAIRARLGIEVIPVEPTSINPPNGTRTWKDAYDVANHDLATALDGMERLATNARNLANARCGVSHQSTLHLVADDLDTLIAALKEK